MNTTVPIALEQGFSAAEKGVLPLVGLVLTPAMSVAFYIWCRRRLNGKEKQEQRVYVFYRALAGILLGQFICHIFFKATTYSPLGFEIMALFVIIGTVFIDVYDNWTRVCNAHDYHTASNHALVDTEIGLDKTRMEQQEYVELRGEEMSSEKLGEIIFDSEDQGKDERKRWHVFICLFFVLTLVVTLEGLFLIYNENENTIALLFGYYANKILQNLVFFGSMVHAKIHIEPARRRHLWWWSITAIWSIIMTCATIPVLANASYDSVAKAIEHPALAAFYCLAGGMTLGISFHFREMKLRQTSTKETTIAIVVYIVFAVLSWATGLAI